MSIIADKIINILNLIFAPRITKYEYSNMAEADKVKFKQQWRKMREQFRKMEDEFNKDFEN